jgi:hypothetical protein
MMKEEPSAKGYPSFKEAYDSKLCSSSDSNEFHLSRKSVKPRKGAVYFVLYQGEDRSEEVERDWSEKIKSTKTLNDMPNLVQAMLEDTPVNPVPKEAPVETVTGEIFTTEDIKLATPEDKWCKDTESIDFPEVRKCPHRKTVASGVTDRDIGVANESIASNAYLKI